MQLRVSYKEHLDGNGGHSAARRWSEDVEAEADGVVATIKRLLNEAHTAGHEITQVLIEHPELQAFG